MSQIQVTYVDHMGDDLRVCNAARISFGKQAEELSDKDSKLIKYLAEHEHMSPFEHNVLTVIVECPVYIATQVLRHRTGAYNMVSRRYTSEEIDFYVPSQDDLRKQAKSNRQSSEGNLPEEIAATLLDEMEDHHFKSLVLYNNLLKAGVCREQARGVLPQNMMTKFYMTMNLRNWAHFVNLRTHEGAQAEIQIIGNMVKNILLEKYPVAAKELFS